MAHKRESLLAQLEVGVLDDSMPVASLLQKCIVLGGRAGSEKMRDWARQELKGYRGDATIPPYRRIRTSLMAKVICAGGFNSKHQLISASMFNQQFRDFLDENDIDLDVAILTGGIGELEALVAGSEAEHWIMPPWSDPFLNVLNKRHAAPSTHVEIVYWPLSDASLRGLLVQVRSALAELVAELTALTPAAQDVPDQAAADQAVQLLITGHRHTFHVTSQHAAGGGTNVAVGSSEGSPVTVTGTGTAIGSQTASGSGSSVVGSQSASGGHNALTGRDSAAGDSAAKHGWWARLRKQGWMVALTTILGGITGVASLLVALLVWLGWMPWWR